MAKKSLLLVDADSKSLRMLEVSLRKGGFSVTTAIHVADAREKLKHATPDLIITDTRFSVPRPGGPLAPSQPGTQPPGDESGFEFVASLKASPETATIPIIFLSSENRLEQKVAGLELGVEDYLTKPIYIKEVLTRVRVLLDKREKQILERRERSSSFSGLLGDMGLVDLMQTVEIGKKTGHLDIESLGGARGQVSFKDGKVTNARSGRLTGERAFYRLLVWNEGRFAMEFGPHDEADVIELSTQGLLMEGMRRVDEWGRLIEQLPPLDHVFEIDFNELVARLAEIPDEINVLLRLFDGRRTMLGVVDETDFGDLEALEIASKLYFEGMIFDVADREPQAAQPHKVEAWLSEPAGTRSDDDDDDQALLLVPPVLARATPPADGGPILAPPTGAAPSLDPTPVTETTTLPPRSDSVELLGASEALPAPRPLPAPINDEPEARGVGVRSAVGATAWSSAPQRNNDDDDDLDRTDRHIIAPEDPTAADGDAQTISPLPPPLLPASTPIAPPPPPLLAAPEGAPPAVAKADDVDAALPPAVAAAAPPLDVAAPVKAEAPADVGEAAPAPQLPIAPTKRSAAELARDLGLSDDELALALSAHDEAGFAKPPPKALSASADAPDLAGSIAAQLDPPSLPPELVNTPASGGFAEHDPQADTDKGGRRGAQPPTPTPDTATPSLVPVPEPAAPKAKEPEAPPSTEPADLVTAPMSAAELALGADDGGHRGRVARPLAVPASAPLSMTGPPRPRPTSVPGRAPKANVRPIEVEQSKAEQDLEPLVIDRFGFSKPAAAALIILGFIIAVVVVITATDDGPEVLIDAGVVVAADIVVDAGAPALGPLDAGGPSAPDAGKETKPGPPAMAAAPLVDAGPKAPDLQADYANHLKVAEAATNRQEFGRSVRSYKAALAIEPDAVAAHLGLGNAYYELDNLPAALFHLERARELAPQDPQVFVHLGAVYQSSGRKGDALDAYQRYLELAPDGKFARDVKGIMRGLKN